MRKMVAVLMAAVLVAAAGCSEDTDKKKGVEVEVDKKDSGGY